DVIKTRFMFEPSFVVLPSLRFGLRPESTINMSIRRDEFSHHSHFLGKVPGANALNRDLGSRFDRGRPEAVANHPARRAGLEGPLLHFAAGILRIEKEPRMRILQPDLSDHTFDRDRLIRIEYCSERMVRP